MEELKDKILKKRAFRRKTVGLMLSLLGRGLQACRIEDPLVRGVMDGMPEGFVFALGIRGSRHPLMLQSRRRGLYRLHESFAEVCQKLPITPQSVVRRFSANHDDPSMMLEIRFKSVEAAWRMVTGKLSAAQSYARHDLIIIGEVQKAMQLVRCIERVEEYLLPSFVAERALPLRHPLPLNRRQIWKRMLYIKRIDRRHPQGKKERGA